MDEAVEGDGWADVPWDGADGGADGELAGEGGGDDEVFLVVHDGGSVRAGRDSCAVLAHVEVEEEAGREL